MKKITIELIAMIQDTDTVDSVYRGDDVIIPKEKWEEILSQTEKLERNIKA